MAAFLEVRNLTLSLPHADPVRDLSFHIEEGEAVAIVGESGSGKSLTAFTLMRLLPPAARIASGQVVLEGTDLLALPERRMRSLRGSKIAMIFQEPMTSLNPVMPIGRQIGEVLRLHKGLSAKAARARSIEFLDLVRLPDPQKRVDDYPHQLSGGMRERVMIAIAIACSPRLLIADEPTTALDVTIQAQILDLLDRLRRDLSMALLLITHALALVGRWADRVLVMYAGRKLEEARPDDLFDAPFHPYTQGLLAASPRFAGHRHYRDGPLTEIPGSIGSATRQEGCPFAPRCPIQSEECCKTMPGLETCGDRHVVACPRTGIKGMSYGLAVGF